MRIFTISFFLIALNISVCGQSSPGKFSIGGQFGISSLAMNDLNTYVEKNFNDAGFDLYSTNNSLNIGLQANYHISNRFALRLGFGYYFPNKQSDSKPYYITDIQGSVIGETLLDVTYASRGYNLSLEPVYKFFQNEKYQFIAGTGILYSMGYLEIDTKNNDLNYYENKKWNNTSFGFMLNAHLEYYLNPFISILGGIQFRYMPIHDLKDEDGNTVIISGNVLDSKKVSLDYSGIELNVGILIYPFKIK